MVMNGMRGSAIIYFLLTQPLTGLFPCDTRISTNSREKLVSGLLSLRFSVFKGINFSTQRELRGGFCNIRGSILLHVKLQGQARIPVSSASFFKDVLFCKITVRLFL